MTMLSRRGPGPALPAIAAGLVLAAALASGAGAQQPPQSMLDQRAPLPDHTIVIVGQGPVTEYTIEVDGRLTQVDGELESRHVSRNDNDAVDNGRATGSVGGGNDGFRVYGEIRSIRLDPQAGAEVLVDGEPYATLRATQMQPAPEARAATPVRRQDDEEDEQDEAPTRMAMPAQGLTAVTPMQTGQEWTLSEAVTSISRRAGWGPVDSTRRLDLQDQWLQGLVMAESTDRPCFMHLLPTPPNDGLQAGWYESGHYILCKHGLLSATASAVGSPSFSRRNNSRRVAALDEDHAVVALEVCVNRTARNARVKGVEVRGWRPEEYLDASLDRARFMARDGFERPNCSERQFTSCPRGQVATGVVATLRERSRNSHWINGFQLICRAIE